MLIRSHWKLQATLLKGLILTAWEWSSSLTPWVQTEDTHFIWWILTRVTVGNISSSFPGCIFSLSVELHPGCQVKVLCPSSAAVCLWTMSDPLSVHTDWSSRPCRTTLRPCSPVTLERQSRTRSRWKELTLMHCGSWCSMHTQVRRHTDCLYQTQVRSFCHVSRLSLETRRWRMSTFWCLHVSCRVSVMLAEQQLPNRNYWEHIDEQHDSVSNGDL